MKKLISVVIPAYDESEVVDELTERLTQLMNRKSEYDFEVIIVENGSRDDTFTKLLKIRERDARFKIVQLSRNFMSDGGVTAGLRAASGDAAVIMNADLQDPPEIVDAFLEKWEAGFEVVYGIIERRIGERAVKVVLTRLYYLMVSRLTGGAILEEVSDFRLVDRKVYKAMNRMQESNRFVRGLSIWSGFRRIGIPFVRAPRAAGQSKAPWLDLLTEALNGIFSFSHIPLRLATFLGLAISVGALFLLIYQFVAPGENWPGYLTIVTVLLVMFGAMFVILGIIGEYIARIYDEVKARPNYIVRQAIGFDPPLSERDKYDGYAGDC